MSKLLTPLETAKWLKERDNFLILTHRRPDGDTLGSAGALAQGLYESGKTAYILTNPEITPRYSRFVEQHYAPDGYDPEHIILVDTASTNLFSANAEKYIDSVDLCIDHHKSNTLFAKNVCLDADKASCGEIIYEILMLISRNISKTTAERLYVALSTDTGCFSFGNTTANTLYVASLLIEAGAPNKELNKILFRTKSQGRIRIEGMVTSGIEYYFDDRVAMASITREMLEKSGADEDDLDDIAALPGSIAGVDIGITIREMLAPDDCKISVRTRAPFNAQEICSHFGGGGHSLAAGSMIKMTIPDVKKALCELLAKQFPGCSY